MNRSATDRDIEIAKTFLEFGTLESIKGNYQTSRNKFAILRHQILCAIKKLEKIPNHKEELKIANECHTSMLMVQKLTDSLIKAGWRPVNYKADNICKLRM